MQVDTMSTQNHYLSKIILIVILFSLIVFMIFYPQQSYQAAQKALLSWWNIVLPSLLPFFPRYCCC